jgi:hypothetical protein
MLAINRFTLLGSDDDGSCRLALDGRALDGRFEGSQLEAQYALTDGRMLVCLSDGSIYDAGLHIYLLAANGDIEDEIEGSAPFTPGSFEPRELQPGQLDFRFFTNDVLYRLNVLPMPRYRFSLPTGWRYKHRLRAHQLALAEQAGGH